MFKEEKDGYRVFATERWFLKTDFQLRKERRTMGDETAKAEARKLWEDKNFMGEVVRGTLADPQVLEDLADSVADEISDVIEDDPAYTQGIIEAAKKEPRFRKLVVKSLIDRLA